MATENRQEKMPGGDRANSDCGDDVLSDPILAQTAPCVNTPLELLAFNVDNLLRDLYGQRDRIDALLLELEVTHE